MKFKRSSGGSMLMPKVRPGMKAMPMSMMKSMDAKKKSMKRPTKKGAHK